MSIKTGFDIGKLVAVFGALTVIILQK